jgi:branched-chain amino acid transport system permease protein
VIVVLGILACYFFLKTPLANSIVCMRENENRASFLGYDPFLTKLISFSFASFLAAISGFLFVFFEKFIGTSSMSLDMSLTIVLMTVIGGPRRLFGPALGASLYILVQDWISNLTDRWWLIMGILFVFVVLYLRGGVISLFESEKMVKIRLLIRGRGN